VSAPYPWLEPAWARLRATRARPAQALLLAGPRGVGKGALAQAWAQALLCEAPRASGEACGSCPACHWFGMGTHPDDLHLGLQEKTTKDGETRLATAIEVEQARAAVEFVHLSTYRAGTRVVRIDPADTLNLAAANALLKVLEEPPLRTVFVLVSDQPRRLLPTLRSRCVRIDLGLPPAEQTAAWLAQQGMGAEAPLLLALSGAPLDAVRLHESGELESRRDMLDQLAQPDALDPVTLGERWKTLTPRLWHSVVYKWLADLLAVHLRGEVRFNPDFAAALGRLGARANRAGLLALARRQAEEGRVLDHPLNRALQMQAWLVQYRRLFG